jgi:tetratricopeptide (TPR) repeat protein
MRRGLALFALVAGLALGRSALAVEAPEIEGAEIGACSLLAPAVEAADQKTVTSLVDLCQTKGPQALAGRRAELEALVLRHKNRSAIEACNGEVEVFSGDLEDEARAGELARIAMVGQATKTFVFNGAVVARDPYVASAAYLAGFLAVERGDAAAAETWLRLSLKSRPGDAIAMSELLNILTTSGKPDQALALAEAFLVRLSERNSPDRIVALIQRRRGSALGELGRYDEAVAAYRTSLKLDPANAVALNEIRYLEGRKRGMPPTPMSQSVQKSPQ